MIPKLFFAVLALVAAIPALLIWGGPVVTDAASWGAKKYLSGLGHLSIDFEKLSGDPFGGYELIGLAVGAKDAPNVVTAGRVFFAVDPQRSWQLKKLVFRAAADGVRVDEGALPRLAEAAQKDFPPSAEPAKPDGPPLEPLKFFVPSVTLADWQGKMGWRLEKLTLEQPHPDEYVYALGLNARYQNEPIALEGKAGLTAAATPEWAAVRARALNSDVTVNAALKDGLIDLKTIEGTLFAAPLKGSAQVDTAKAELPLRADLSLRQLDLAPLRRWVPGLGPSRFDGLELHVSGSASAPRGKAQLKNGTVAYQQYKASEIGGTVTMDGKNADVDLSARFLGSLIAAAGRVGLTGARALDLKASVSPLALKNLVGILPDLKSAELEGTVTAAAHITGTADAPKTALTVSSPGVSAMKQYTVSDISLKAVATLKEVLLDELSAQAFKGRLQAQGRVGLGNVPTFDLDGAIRGLDLHGIAPDITGTLDGSFHLDGTAAKPKIALEARIDKLDAGQFGARQVAVQVSGSEKLDVHIKGKTKYDTAFGGGGTVGLPIGGRKSSLDLSFKLDQMKLSELLANTMKYAGAVTADVIVKGSFEKPEVSAELRSKEITASGYTIHDPVARAVLKGTRADVTASVAMGDKRPSVTGFVDFAKGLKAVFEAEASEVRVDAAHPSLKGAVDGRVSLRAHASVNGSDVSAHGKLTSPVVSSAGARVEHINVPFVFAKNHVSVPDGTFKVGGGTLHLNANGRVDKGTYEFALEGGGIDLRKLTKPMAIPAVVNGTASVKFNGSARTGLTTIMRGNGRLRFKNIVVDQFPGQMSVTGKSPFKVQHGNVFFNVNDGEVHIMPGSALTAWPDDKLYHFVSFSGLAWRQDRVPPKLDPSLMPQDLAKSSGEMYHMFVNGSINVRVINGLLGGLGAVIEAGATGNLSTQSIASNFLQKFIGGAIATQVRDVDIDVSGEDYSDVRVNKLKFGGEGSYADVATTEWTEDATATKKYQRYSLSYPLPVGPDPSKLGTKKKRSKK